MTITRTCFFSITSKSHGLMMVYNETPKHEVVLRSKKRDTHIIIHKLRCVNDCDRNEQQQKSNKKQQQTYLRKMLYRHKPS